MNNKEKRLSDYIDSLNEERKPVAHEGGTTSPEMEELFETVRLVRSLKEPSMPERQYSERLAEDIGIRLLKQDVLRKPRRKWFYGLGSIAAAAVLVVTLNVALPLNKTNMVYAMEQAFKEVKAYHGILEVVETNAEGKSTTQTKVEVWADKEGRYYVKGLEGAQKDVITINDGQKKWQVQPQEKEVDIFTAFPDLYSFTFEIGREIEDVKNAVSTKVIGEDTAAGRKASIIEVTPQGGSPYKIWVDKETKMPLQKQSSMEYSLQYKVRYTNIDFSENIPKELFAFNVPSGFKETNKNTEQIVGDFQEVKSAVGFIPKTPKVIPASYVQKNITLNNDSKVSKINYASQDNKKKISIFQKKASSEFEISSMAVHGKINTNTAEIQAPVQDEAGILQGVGAYAGAADITSVRWQQDGFEYAVVGNVSLEDLKQFIKEIAGGTVELTVNNNIDKPTVEVPVDLEAEKGDQKNADAGHSPWKLDPVFVSQVFASLKLSPEGIQGAYPVKYEEIKIIQNNGKEAVAEISGAKTTVKRVYLKRLVRQDNTGIWTVVGYDPVNK